MKNMKVSMKLISGFLIIAVLAAVVGVVGIVGMEQISNEFDDMYIMQTVALPQMSKVIDMLQSQRVCLREFIVGEAVGDNDLIESAYSKVQGYRTTMAENMDKYVVTIRDVEAQNLFREARNIYETDFKECVERIYALSKSGTDAAELYSTLKEYTEMTNKVIDNFEKCMNMKIDRAANQSHTAGDLSNSLLLLIIGVIAAVMIIAVFLAIYISGLVSKPLAVLSSFMKRVGSTGDITITKEEADKFEHFGETKDEIGETITGCSSFITNVVSTANHLEHIAGGDLTNEVKLLSDKDTIGKSLNEMLDNLNDMFTNIQASTGQVTVGSKQVADGAQSLAQGATEQAASIQQLSSSISDIASKTKSNAAIAEKTLKLSLSIKENAEKGSTQMDHMIAAVKEINEASQSISKIIKTIDDIAFQTNILALNAAVEAARAGQHGKGFAVVAEEVRNLASKSAEAAKDTGNMIQNSMEKAEFGSQIAWETATSLKDIVTGINESSHFIAEIATGSEEQSLDITQVNIGIDQVAQVVQQNSATAEESAAASEEMSSQAAVLEELISRFKLKNELMSAARRMPIAERAGSSHYADPVPISSTDGFGKY